MNGKSQRSEEAARLHAWCQEVLRILYKMAPGEPGVPLAVAQHGLDVALKRGDVKGLKTAARDFFEWARGLSDDQQARIDRELRSKLGVGLGDRGREIKSDVAAIRARGSIADDDEYRLVEARTIEISADPVGRDELKALNELLTAYGNARR